MIMYRIKEIAKKQRITLREIAFKINLAPNTLSRIINGENTTIDTLLKIAHVLDVDVKDLFQSSKDTDTIYLIVNNKLHTFTGGSELKKFVDDFLLKILTKKNTYIQ